MLLFCLAVLAAPYFALRSNTLYCRHNQVFWNANDCVKFSLRRQQADIVLVGDSSLVFGVRPDLIQRRLKQSAFNLGQPAGGMIFYPGMLLDHYLARNSRPRLIILYVGAWTLLKHQEDLDHLWDDGATAAIRHGNLQQIGTIFADDPRRLVRVPIVFLHQGLVQFSRSDRWWRDASAEMRAGRGWFAVWRPGRPFATQRPGGAHEVPVALPDRCTLPVKALGALNRRQIEQFRKTYQRDGTRVLVYVAPVPDCDPTYPAIVHAYAGIADNRPRTMPGHDFIDDGWRIHTSPEGADRATKQVCDFIESFLVLQRLELHAAGSHARTGPG